MPASPVRYDPIAKALHWLIALAIIGMLALGWIMKDPPNGMDKFTLFQLHKSIGITIMLLALFRLIWRFRHKPPPLPNTMRPWEKAVANGTHALLYALMIGMPFIGWIIVSTSPYNLPTILYGVIHWPHLPMLHDLSNRKEISELARDVHGYLAWVIVAVVVLHAAAAWKHHLINRDDVLTRMAPGFLTGFLNRIRGKK